MLFTIATVCVLAVLAETGATTFDFSGNVSAQTQQPRRGDSVTIYCETATASTETLYWFKDGININQLTLMYTEAGNSLSIQSYDIQYDGFYHCVARYNDTSDTATSAVQIQASPPIALSSYETRYFTVQPRDYIARLSNPVGDAVNPYEAITFTCTLIKTFRGVSPIITWQVIENEVLRNVTDFDDEEEVIIQHDHIGYYQLHHPNIGNDGLRARCVATSSDNPAEVVYSNWAVANVTTEIEVLDTSNVFTETAPSLVYVDPGQSVVRIPCGINDGRRGQMSTYQWFYETESLYFGTFQFTPQSGIRRFGYTNLEVAVSTVQQGFTGEFICRTRIAGIDKSIPTQIIIGEAPTAGLPVITIQKSQQIVLVDTTRELTFSTPDVESASAIRLWHNGVLEPNISDEYFIQTSSDETQVIIKNATVSDSGVYQLEIVQGSRQMFSVEIHVFVLIPQVNIAASPFCSVMGTVAPNVTTPYACYPPIPLNGQLHSTGLLEISSGLSAENEGDIMCTSDTLNFRIKTYIISPTVITEGSEDTIADIGSQITLQCAVIDYPAVENYQWTMNNILIQQGPANSLSIDTVMFGSIGSYQCSPMTDGCIINSTTIQLDIRLPVVQVDALNDTIEKILPDSPNGYNCTPPIPNGEINELGELIIGSEAEESATGKYKCSNQNNEGIFHIDLNVFAKAYVTYSSEDVVQAIGSSATIECSASGIPNIIEYAWLKDGISLPQATSQSLVIPFVRPIDLGEYECLPSNQHGTFNSSRIRLDARVFRTINILGEESVQILPPSVTDYDCSPDIQITKQGLLTVNSQLATREYLCSTDDFNGTFIVDLNITAPAYVVESIGDVVELEPGDNITLWCRGDGIPDMLTYQWRINGELSLDQTSSNYSIFDVSMADIGIYECIPSNSEGTHNTSVTTLNIKVSVKLNTFETNRKKIGPESITEYQCSPPLPNDIILSNRGTMIAYPGISRTSSDEYTCSSDELNGSIIADVTIIAPAYVVSNTDRIIADFGTNKSIECIANGIPDTIQYQWTKNGATIPGSNNPILNLRDVSVNDIGEYECIPSNSEGTHNTSITELIGRIVDFEVNALSNQILRVLPPAPSGYECRPPLPLDGMILNTGQLMLRAGLTTDDSGEHICTSSDLSGTVILDLEVHAAAYVICSSENQEVDLGASVTFECVAGGIPNNITFTWKKNGEVIAGETGPDYTIDTALITDVGRYQCIPMNSFGYHNSSTMELKVKVIEEFDWLTRYNAPGKFPAGSSYGCLPLLPPRITITDDGDFITTGLLLEDDKKYICSSNSIDGFFVFHPIVQGYAPNPVILDKPVFTVDGLAIFLRWTPNITQLRPVDRYMIMWSSEEEDRHDKRHEFSIITTYDSYNFTDFSENTLYMFWVIALNELGPSQPSDEHDFDVRIEGIRNDREDIEVWLIVIIVICAVIFLLICCICCFFCLYCCYESRQKVYYAEKEEAKNAEEMARYRKKGEEEGEGSDFSMSDSEEDESSITGDDVTSDNNAACNV